MARAKRSGALARVELGYPTEPRAPAAGVTSFAVKVEDPADRAMIEAALTPDARRNRTIRHAIRKGVERSNHMTRGYYDRLCDWCRGRVPDLVNSTGQKGYLVASDGVQLLAVWDDELDIICTFLPGNGNPNWRKPDSTTLLGQKLKEAMGARR